MQYKLSHLPILKIIIPLLTGIFLFNYISIPFKTQLIICISLFIGLSISHFTISNSLSKTINLIFVYVLIFFVGGLMITNKKIETQDKHFSNYKNDFAKGIISSSLEEKDKSYKTVIEITQTIDSTKRIQNCNGKLLVYIQKDSVLSSLEIGDEVLFKLNSTAVEKPKNPGQFDYRNYLKHKAIFQQQYITANSISIIQKHKILFIKRISDNIGKYVQNILRTYIPKKENFALADGILLGHRADIDVDLYNAFAYTGIMHILSVSGLHVGIIYTMLLFFLSFIKDKNIKIKIAKFIFIFCFIWLFAFVTGLSSACVRAAILFSLLNFGKLNKEHVSNLNLLAGAALLQILIDPNNVYDIGFQLSYLAMLGLFIFYKPIHTIFYFKNKFANWTWNLWSASIAAQCFTVPLSIYYFGNFPTYFLFANIFAIPLSAIILWLSMALIPLSFIPILAKAIGWVASFVISTFIQLTYFISNLPLGKLYNIYITEWQLLILFFGVLLITTYIINRKAKFILAGLTLFLISIFTSYSYNIKQLQKDEIILYAVPKNFVLAINKKNKQLLFSKDSIAEKTFSFCVKNSHRVYRINEHKNYLLNDSTNNEIFIDKDLIVANNKSFYFLTYNNTRKTFVEKLKIDYLVLSENCYLNIESIQSNFEYKQIILSSDNNNKHIKIYKKILDENKIDYFDLSESAMIIE